MITDADGRERPCKIFAWFWEYRQECWSPGFKSQIAHHSKGWLVTCLPPLTFVDNAPVCCFLLMQVLHMGMENRCVPSSSSWGSWGCQNFTSCIGKRRWGFGMGLSQPVDQMEFLWLRFPANSTSYLFILFSWTYSVGDTNPALMPFMSLYSLGPTLNSLKCHCPCAARFFGRDAYDEQHDWSILQCNAPFCYRKEIQLCPCTQEESAVEGCKFNQR